MKYISLITKSIVLLKTALKTKRVKLSLKIGENFMKGVGSKMVFNTKYDVDKYRNERAIQVKVTRGAKG